MNTLVAYLMPVVGLVNLNFFLITVVKCGLSTLITADILALLLMLVTSALISRVGSISFSLALKYDSFSFSASFLLYLFFLASAFLKIPETRALKLSIGISYTTFLCLKAAAFLYLFKKFRLSGTNSKRLGVILFAFVFIFYSLLALWTTKAIPPTGDEPLYLLSAKSLAVDGDLNISNNYRSGQWKEFMPESSKFSLGEEEQRDGRYYMNERVLFTALLAIPFSLGSFLATSLLMCLISAFFIYLIYRYVLAVGFGPGRSFMISLLAAFVQPMLTMNSRIYHNTMGSALVLLAFMLIYYGKKNGRDNLFTAVIIAALPWIHLVYLPFSITLLVMYSVEFSYKKRYLFLVYFMLLLDAIMFILYRISVRNGLADFTGINNYQLTPCIYRSLAALFFDQEGGLFFLSPVYLLFLTGLSATLVVDRAFGFLAKPLFLVSGFLILQGSLPAFGGGYDTCRSLMPLLPFITIFTLRAFENRQLRYPGTVLIIVSVFLGYLWAAIPWLAINYEIGKNVFLGPLSAFLPSFNIPGHQHYGFIAVFMIVLATAGALKKTRFNWR